MRIWLVGKSGMLANSFEKLFAKLSVDYFVTGEQEVNICNEKAVNAITGYTHVFNCAAYTDVDKAESEEERAYQVNCEGVRNLALAAKKNSAKLVHFSTDFVFDGKKRKPYLESDPPSPLSVYGKSKWEGEKAALEISAHNLIIRTSWLFGRGRGNFVKTMVRLLQEKKSLRVVGDQVGKPTYADDLAKATLDLLEQEGIYHVAGKGEISWHGFAEVIAELLPEESLICETIEKIRSEEYPTAAARPEFSVLSTKKAQEFIVARDWKEGLSDYVQELIKS
ncbi:MAG: dTDP-4-dehydrorhamnose reductase [Candidatus Algichlamydia australiensis]|nr:dTDP-4-dehydrorhamnose reductase [Chlamydiales bacterium]